MNLLGFSTRLLRSKICPTQPASDWWKSARFRAVFWAQAGCGQSGLSHPTCQRVTRAVGRLVVITANICKVEHQPTILFSEEMYGYNFENRHHWRNRGNSCLSYQITW